MLRAGEVVGRFAIQRRLGSGGMGVVYEAVDMRDETAVALKMLSSVTGQLLLRFKNEFRALQDLEHPNLVRLGELIEHDGAWFFTMELIEGGDFIAHIRPDAGSAAYSSHREAAYGGQRLPPAGEHSSAGPIQPVVRVARECFDERRLRSALGQLALGITVLHDAGLVHRDVKPSNVIVTREGRVVLLDFGLLLRENSSFESSHHATVGTAAYMAPEQATWARPGPAADWYAFGVLLYEALTGSLPFTGAPVQILMDKQQHTPPPPRAWVADVPADLEELCTELLRFDPASRPNGAAILHRLGVVDVCEVSRRTTSGFAQRIPFVGRDQELERMAEAMAQVQAGNPTVVFVHGQSGVGKSELVHQFAARLREADDRTIVLAARCYERESVPYRAFDGIADALSEYLGARTDAEVAELLPLRAALLSDLFRVLQRVEAIARAPLERAEGLDPQELRKRMFKAVRELLARIADRNPLVLVIDDFQWADADSLVLLDEIFHPQEAPTTLVLATARRALDGGHCAAVQTARRIECNQVHIDLEPLSQDNAQELVRLLSPQQTQQQPELARTIAEEADGHPLFIQELVRCLDEAPGELSSTRLDAVLWSRISRLGAPARELLELLCVAGAPTTRRVAALAMRVAPSQHERAISTLRVGFLARAAGTRTNDTLEPYHDRVRETVLAHLTDTDRRRYHERLAIALERAGAGVTEPQALLAHLEAAGNDQRAASVAEDAARMAARALAFDQAAELYQTALRLGEHSPARTLELRLLLGDALVNAGRGHEAAQAFLLASSDATGNVKLDCQRQAAEQLLFSGHIREGLDALQQLLSEVGVALPKTPRLALASLLWQRAKLRLRGIRWTRVEESDVAPGTLTRIEVYKAVAHGLGIVDSIRGADFQARGLLIALRTGEEFRICRAMTLEAGFLGSQGSHERAKALLLRARGLAEQIAHPYLIAFATVIEGCTSYFEGRFEAAAASLRQAEELFRGMPGKTLELNLARTFRLFTCRYQGKVRELHLLYDDYVRDAHRRGDRYAETTIRRCCNQVFLADDDLDNARQNLARASWMPPEGVFHLQHWYELEADIEQAIYSGHASECDFSARFEAITHSMLLRVVTVRAYLRWEQGRLALARAESAQDATELLREASKMARRLSRERNGYSEVWGSLLRAGIAARQDQPEHATSWLEKTIALAEQHAMPLMAAVARRHLGDLVGGDAGRKAIALSEQWMTTEGIRRSDRTCALFGPGFRNPA